MTDALVTHTMPLTYKLAAQHSSTTILDDRNKPMPFKGATGAPGVPHAVPS